MRKRNSNAKLLNLPEATQRAIFALSNEARMSVDEIRDRLAASIDTDFDDGGCGFGIKVGTTAIYAFLGEWRVKLYRERLHRGGEIAEQCDEDLTDEQRASLDQNIMDGLRVWIQDSVISRDMSAKDAKSLVALIQKSRALALDERKLALLEKKAAAFDQIEEAAEDDNLTPEQRLEKIRKGLKI